MDFYKIRTRTTKSGQVELYADFLARPSKDMMVQGGKFYAIWDEEKGLWSQDAYDVIRLVDAHLYKEAEKYPGCIVKDLSSSENGRWKKFVNHIKDLDNSFVQLNQKIVFSNSETKKTDYASFKLPYPLEAGDYSAWDELIGTLYSTEERAKIEWMIGAIVSGDSKKIQKFLVLYGSAGTGKSTILNIVQKLFEGYTTSFESSALGKGSSFALESFRTNPLVAIQHDGDLSRIEDNTLLNSIIAHEPMTINEKYKSAYTARISAVLLMGTNSPVRISDARSGIIRRLIDVQPSGATFPTGHYNKLMSRIQFELGAIAHHCLEVYLEKGSGAYNTYRPVEMMYHTDPFFNFIEANYDIFKAQNSATMAQAWDLYKAYCVESGSKQMQMHRFRNEFSNYFEEFHERGYLDGMQIRNFWTGFKVQNSFTKTKNDKPILFLEKKTSLLDDMLADMPAQYSKTNEAGQEIPAGRWSKGNATLATLDTSKLHFVKLPHNHIVIDFDLKDLNGTKSLQRNLEAAAGWPPTYAELSQGGNGVHLHYIYDGDVETLAQKFSDGIEVKSLLGNASLRRRLTKCNDIPVATISSGLPIKEKPVIDSQVMHSEKTMRDLIGRNLRKEIHPGTKPSIDFIKKILDDAYSSGMQYDVTDLRSKIVAFAGNSSNRALECLKVVNQMKWASEEIVERQITEVEEEQIAFFDVEVYQNLFVVCWKYRDGASVTKMVNPSAQDVEQLFKLKLVGFNNRRYDNHILYARYMGYNNKQLYDLSQRIINNDRSAMFGAAYDLSYADILDFSSVKQGLKKFQIQLGIFHMEMDIPWDQPVPDDRIEDVVKYCENDVISTEKVFESRYADFVARQILSELSGIGVNQTTQNHAARIIFGDDKRHKDHFVYTDLSKEFPGYKFEMGKSSYRGEDPSEGGYVYAEPGLYSNVAVLDIASMHPTSIEQLNLFGKYTKTFSELKEARVAIKRKDYERAKTFFDGRLARFLVDTDSIAGLSDALKIIINTVYGLTSSTFDNPFRDLNNKDNIVAKRGALFMIDLKHALQEQGHQVIHIKTDSIKIHADEKLALFVQEFGAKYGYEFEHEGTFDKFCLVNDAVYIAREGGKWKAVGAQFQHPYVLKTLFTGEEVTFDDLCEAKSVQAGAMYLDFEHDRAMALHEGMHFVGRTGLFVPVLQEAGGGRLFRVKDEKLYSIAGTKNYLWMEAEMARTLSRDMIDMGYFETLADDARKTIDKFGGGYAELMDGF